MSNKKSEAEQLTYEVTEARDKIGLSRNAFYKAVSVGEIPSVRIGGKILIPKRPFDKMLG